MDLSFGNMKVRLNIFNASDQPSQGDDCFMIDCREVLEDDFAILWGDDELITCEDGSDTFEVNNSITDLQDLLHCPSPPNEIECEERSENTIQSEEIIDLESFKKDILELEALLYPQTLVTTPLWRDTNDPIPSLTHPCSIDQIESQLGIILEEINQGEESKNKHHPVGAFQREYLDEVFNSKPISELPAIMQERVINEVVEDTPRVCVDRIGVQKNHIKLKKKLIWGWLRRMWKKRKRKGQKQVWVWEKKSWKNIMIYCLGREYPCGRGRGRQKSWT
jgi:hypothetical protein